MEEYVTPLKAGLKWGLYLALVSMVVSLVGHYATSSNMVDPSTIETVLSFGISIGAVVMGQLYFKQNNEGLMTYGEGVSISLFIGIFSGLLMAVFFFVFMSYVDPDVINSFKDAMAADDSLSQEDQEMQEAITGAFASPIMIALLTFIGSLLMHLFIGLITSIFIKKA